MRRIFNRWYSRKAIVAIIVCAVIATIAASYVLERIEPTEVVTNTSRQERSQTTSEKSEMPDLDLDRLHRARGAKSDNDLFALKVPPAPPPPSPPPKFEASPPAADSAPPLPFQYVGKMVDGGLTLVFLSKQEQDFSAKAGDIIDSTYRIDKISEASIGFTYIPLNIKQELSIRAPE